jgi:hypothetical protein
MCSLLLHPCGYVRIVVHTRIAVSIHACVHRYGYSYTERGSVTYDWILSNSGFRSVEAQVGDSDSA